MSLIVPIMRPQTDVGEGSVPMISAIEYSATGKIFTSLDLGVTWSANNLVGSTNNILSVVHRDESVLVNRIGSAATKPEYSTNGAAQFAQIPYSGSYPSGCCVSANANVFGFLSNYYLFLSFDKGATWSSINRPTLGVSGALYGLTISEDGQYIYITDSASSKIVYSNDYASTWNSFAVACTNYSIACSRSGQHIYAGTFSNAPHTLLVSHDYGATWNNVDIPGAVPSIRGTSCCDAGKYVFVFSPSAAKGYVSNDYGATWTEVLEGESNVYAFQGMHVNSTGKYMAIGNSSVDGKLYISTDYGVSWTDITINAANYPVRGVCIN